MRPPLWHAFCNPEDMSPGGPVLRFRRQKMTYASLQQFALSVVGALIASSLLVSAAVGPIPML